MTSLEPEKEEEKERMRGAVSSLGEFGQKKWTGSFGKKDTGGDDCVVSFLSSSFLLSLEVKYSRQERERLADASHDDN